jgi:hypothetical protein
VGLLDIVDLVGLVPHEQITLPQSRAQAAA